MSRLLLAAARGARIQGEICGKWMTTRGICPDVDRIHPEDEHLQYGTISSALREAAECQNLDDVKPVFDLGLGEFWLTWFDCMAIRRADDLSRPLFLLILAEALADEGL